MSIHFTICNFLEPLIDSRDFVDPLKLTTELGCELCAKMNTLNLAGPPHRNNLGLGAGSPTGGLLIEKWLMLVTCGLIRALSLKAGALFSNFHQNERDSQD